MDVTTKEEIWYTKDQNVCNTAPSVVDCDKDVPVIIAKESNEGDPLIFVDDYYHPDETICPHCKNCVQPVVDYRMGFLPFLVMCFMIMTCTFALLSWLPLIDKRVKTVIHYCPSCNREIWRLIRMWFSCGLNLDWHYTYRQTEGRYILMHEE